MCVLIHYLNRKISIEISVNFSRVRVTLTHKQNIFVRAITMKLLSIKASYFIFETWTAKRSRVLLFEAKGQRSANLWLPGCTSVLKENLNISSSQILPYLCKDAGWYKECVKNVKEQKRSFIKVNRDVFPKIFMFSSFFFVFCVRTCVSCRRFVIKVWWFSAGLEHSLSTITIIWLL